MGTDHMPLSKWDSSLLNISKTKTEQQKAENNIMWTKETQLCLFFLQRHYLQKTA